MWDWLGDYWLQAIGTLLSGGALFFAWRGWVRTGVRWRMSFTLDRRRKEYGELKRDGVLFVTCVVACRRNSFYVNSIELRGGRRSAPLRMNHGYPQLAPPATLKAGGDVRQSLSSDDIIPYHRGPDGPVKKACWIDAEGRPHCRPFPKDMLAQLLADTPQ